MRSRAGDRYGVDKSIISFVSYIYISPSSIIIPFRLFSRFLGIYKMTVDNDKLGLTKEVIATKVLPFLFPLSIENGLTPNQYNVIMALVRQLINRVEEEHRAKLEQLHSIQDEQRCVFLTI